MKVKTLRPIYVGGREHQKGDTVDLPEKRARALLRLRRVEKLKGDAGEVDKPKRQYRRRDLTAESE